METVGQRIKRLREQKRWTQGDLALRLDVTSKTVGNWENGRNDPRSSIGALEKVFGQSLTDGLDAPAEERDAVEEAVRRSRLIGWRQNDVITTYQRHLYEQDEAEGRRSG
ncbi:transcriptional regulator with XRE-family HTH domain [Nocardioides ginsengisegetis]|uniref:Transcriptional regulator with XRE-family HTH domain n=1 Tax=Nocardioides ginsengisegetis TaxID=661491 RepID=A0A7W3P7V7_9ACTN|nr:helix-turn-helix transcriptional regulator [Nocardioides ginsengisegetis]MBA8801716.1 transcriptional regulator with XRE-family HTH domain [Nocardioides ginsengisegetis]MBA8805571.1 transcriptional regulator with XRE-family HTH domain [Nocardioides ginsengisegetis]